MFLFDFFVACIKILYSNNILDSGVYIENENNKIIPTR